MPPIGDDDDIDYVDVLDLSGPTISATRHRLPVAAGVFAAESASSWAIAGGYFASGVVFDSDNLEAEGGPAPLNCGAAYTIAGSDSGQVAISTASGQILYVDLGTRTLVRVVNSVSGKVELSGDGSVLGATGDAFNAQYAVDPSVKVYAMPSGELLHTWPTTYREAFDVSVAQGGARVGRGRAPNPVSSVAADFSVTDPSGATTYFHDTADHIPPILLSPGGERVALTAGIDWTGFGRAMAPSSTTRPSAIRRAPSSRLSTTPFPSPSARATP